MARILVADDSLIVRKSYENMLVSLGHEVILCNDGKEAVDAFLSKSADLLILDVDMPGMDGLQACKEIRLHSKGISVPIIIVSALDEEGDILNGLNAGANDYLVKPVKEAHLVAKLKTFLGISALHRKDFELVKEQMVVQDKYRIEKLIGYSGHSTSFLVADLETKDKKYVMKLMREMFADELLVNYFVSAAQKISTFNSPYVLKIFDIGKFLDRVYLIEEFAPEGDLQTMLKRRRLTELEAAQIGHDIVIAIRTFRDNSILHLDVKPGNILKGKGGYKLGDFGVVAPRNHDSTPLNTEIWSTSAYVSPEYLTLQAELSSKSDIYSLGICLYQGLTGDNPFDSERPSVGMFRQVNLMPPSLHDIDRNISPFMSDTVLAMLDKDPQLRPNEAELEEVFATLIDYSRCRENQVRVAQKTGIGRVARIEGEETPEAEETVADMLKTAQLTVSSSFLEKRLSKMPIFNRRGGRKLTSQLAEVGSLIDALRSLTSMQLKIVVLSIMVILVSVFAGILGYYVFYENDEPPPVLVSPASITMICKKCGNVGERQEKNLEGAKCTRCGGASVPAVKCRRCSYVFPLPEIKNADKLTREDYEKLAEKVHKCPSCGSSDFFTPASRSKR